MDNPFKSPAILSLCPGVLGLERGLERAIGRVNVVAYVEIEAFIIANLVAAMEQGVLAPAPIWSDVKTFNPERFRGKLHGIIGGYPCQPFSNAGNRLGTDDPRHLFPYIHRIIAATGPVWCFFENVEGHITMGYDTVYKSLRALGYSVEAGVYSAEEAGAPHQRNRLFILAIRADIVANPLFADWVAAALRQNLHALCEECEIGGIELGNPQHHGCATIPQLRSDETSGSERGQEEQDATRQFKGAIGRFNATGLRRCEGGEQPRGSSENELANARLFGQAERQEPPAGVEQCSETFGSEELANPDGIIGGLRESGRNTPEREDDQRRLDRWPARPGQQQYDWEEPRTIEPALGCTANGYNFREDFLRALGNGVVEQTAEIAFKDLLRKHIENISINI